MSIRSDLREGHQRGVPVCCRWRFALEYALRPNGGQAVERGIRFTEDEIENVPCEIVHKATLTHREFEVLLARRGWPWP